MKIIDERELRKTKTEKKQMGNAKYSESVRGKWLGFLQSLGKAS